jgi:uncharacterized membrane protein
MRTLLVLGFPYSTSADAAAQDILLQEPDLATEPDAVAVVSRDDDGAFHVTTNHSPGEEGRSFFWHLVLTALVFLPGSGTLGEGDLRVFSRRLEALGFDDAFQDRLREMLAPDTSALFLLATQPVPADALTALGRFGGKLLAASLVPDVEAGISDVLSGTRRSAVVPTVPTAPAPADDQSPAGLSATALPHSRPSPDTEPAPGGSSRPDETPPDGLAGAP